MKPTLTGLAAAVPRESVLAVAAVAAATPSSETTATTISARLDRTRIILTLRELAASPNMRPDSGVRLWAWFGSVVKETFATPPSGYTTDGCAKQRRSSLPSRQ